MATLTTQIADAINLNGDKGSFHSESNDTSVVEIYSRTYALAAGDKKTLVTISDLEASSIDYIRVTNVSSGDVYVILDGASMSTSVKITKGKSFILSDGNFQAATSAITDPTSGDTTITSIGAYSETTAKTVEIFIAYS